MRLSRKDIFFLSLRITITLSLIYYMGVIKGLLILWTYFTSMFYLMKWVFGLESLSPIDTLLNHDDDKNVANIVSKPFKSPLPPAGAVILEKYDTDQLVKQVYAKAERIFRARAKLVKVMGKYFYKKMDEEEFKTKFPKFC